MRIFLVIVIVTVVLFATLKISMFDDEENSVAVTPIPGLTVDEEGAVIRDFRIFRAKDGEKVLELMAETAHITNDESKIDIKNFSLVSFSGSKENVTLTAQNGAINNENNDMEVFGRIVAHDKEGRALLTDRLNLTEDGARLATEDKVRFFGPGFVMTAKGMVAYPKLEKVELLSDVVAVFFSGANEN